MLLFVVVRLINVYDHSYCSYAFVENVDEIFKEFNANGAEFTQTPSNKPWGLREFGVVTPDGHRIMFGQEIG